jgi:hypothetical protein
MDVDQRSNPPTYLIEWNQYTLAHMPPAYGFAYKPRYANKSLRSLRR